MKINILLTSLVLLLFVLCIVSLMFLPSSIRLFCKMNNCGLCNIIGHHIDQIRELFATTFNFSDYLWLHFIGILISISGIFSTTLLKTCFQKDYIDLKLYRKYKLFNSPHLLLFNPLERAYSDGIIEPQIYNFTPSF